MEKIISMYDKYSLEARFYPTFIAFIPIWLISYFIQDQIFSGMSMLLKILSSSVFIAPITYFAIDIVRMLGKNLETNVFDNGKYFPTTDLLLTSNNIFSYEKRLSILKKIKSDFEILFIKNNKIINKEPATRIKLAEAVELVRNKVDKGRLVFQSNIRYGFWRNLISVSLFSSIASIVTAITFFVIYGARKVEIVYLVMALFYLILWLLRKKILIYFGQQYARQLFIEYLLLK